MSFAIDTIVQVNIDRLTKFPTRQGFGVPLLLDINTVQDVGAVDQFNEVPDMLAAGFVAADQAVLWATAQLSQSPRPPFVKVGRREANVAQVSNVDVTGADDGTYEITINGVPFQFVAVADTPAAIAAGLIAAINAGAEPVTAAPGGGDDLDLTADVPGAGFSVALTTNPNSNMVLTTPTPDVGPTSELARVTEVDNDFYFTHSSDRSEQAILQLAKATELVFKTYFFETDQASSKDLDAASDTTSILGQLKALNLDRTIGVWTKTSNLDNYPSAAWVGKNAPKDPGSITWKFKQVNGVVADDQLTITEKANILVDKLTPANGKNANVYTTVGGLAIFEDGTVMSGEFIDIIRGTDFLAARIKEAVFATLTQNDKVDFTDGGIQTVLEPIRGVLELGITQKILTEDPAPIVSAPSVDAIPPAERAARFLDKVTFEGTYAGAIHKVKMQGSLSI